MTKKVQKVVETITPFMNDYCNQIYFIGNTVGDPMKTLYEDDDLQIDLCEGYGYFEVLGLTKEEEAELDEWHCRYTFPSDEESLSNVL